MAKWFGAIGFAETVETNPGVWTEQITEVNYYGDVMRDSRTLQTTDQLNDNVNIANKISIVADPFAIQHFHNMRYAVYMGAKWKVSTVEVQRTRLILTIGGLWNGEQI